MFFLLTFLGFSFFYIYYAFSFVIPNNASLLGNNFLTAHIFMGSALLFSFWGYVSQKSDFIRNIKDNFVFTVILWSNILFLSFGGVLWFFGVRDLWIYASLSLIFASVGIFSFFFIKILPFREKTLHISSVNFLSLSIAIAFVGYSFGAGFSPAMLVISGISSFFLLYYAFHFRSFFAGGIGLFGICFFILYFLKILVG